MDDNSAIERPLATLKDDTSLAPKETATRPIIWVCLIDMKQRLVSMFRRAYLTCQEISVAWIEILLSPEDAASPREDGRLD
jgi:hypothetical protein